MEVLGPTGSLKIDPDHYETRETEPPNSRLGQARQTFFEAGSNLDGQWSTLDIGKGRLVVDAGFGCASYISTGYGFTLAGAEVPLGLDLFGYSGFQLNFQGVATSEELIVVITVWPQSGGYYNFEVVLPSPNPNAFSLSFPFSGFVKGGGGGGLTQADVSNINFIVVQAEGLSASFGITSFQAVN